MPRRRCCVIHSGKKRQTNLEATALATWQCLQNQCDAITQRLDLRKPGHQRPTKPFGQQKRQHPRAFAGFRLAAGQHHLCAGVAYVICQRGQRVSTVGLFKHMQFAQAHTQIGAQCWLFRVAGVQHLQVIPNQLQAKFDCTRVLFGAARTA
ncbi:WD40 repeat protein [Pseudomonas syringae pv. actinidiae]|uniref:WD40 repeat protein n=1 Tax=Pseudomonas syringae pv. actinidiae TaxID=103796 RepID=A0A2V0Q427_PSESF|nr:WD40 repeat protein [Pseudomonas syringae pv. actinidiae]